MSPTTGLVPKLVVLPNVIAKFRCTVVPDFTYRQLTVALPKAGVAVPVEVVQAGVQLCQVGRAG